jgi:hypothetical protein
VAALPIESTLMAMAFAAAATASLSKVIARSATDKFLKLGFHLRRDFLLKPLEPDQIA